MNKRDRFLIVDGDTVAELGSLMIKLPQTVDNIKEVVHHISEQFDDCGEENLIYIYELKKIVRTSVTITTSVIVDDPITL